MAYHISADSFHRWKSLRTHQISTLPVAVLMIHSACNARCMMCDIWKGNKNLKQLSEGDISQLLKPLRELKTQLVLLSQRFEKL